MCLSAEKSARRLSSSTENSTLLFDQQIVSSLTTTIFSPLIFSFSSCQEDMNRTSASMVGGDGQSGWSSSKQQHSLLSCGRGYPVDGGGFEFVSPPEAPIFYPTEEEFAEGPLEYVSKIKAKAEAYGICKIVPPSSFKPSFAVDRKQFRFTPRVQRLNELEASTRIKLNFLEQVIKYWDLQGNPHKIPYVDKRPIDLHLLHKTVQEEGGFESCTRDKKWSRVALRLGYNISKQSKGPVASLLRQHYERLLFPYDIFLSGATIVPVNAAASATDDASSSSDCHATQDEEHVKQEEQPCPEQDDEVSSKANNKPLEPLRRMTRRSGGQRPQPTTTIDESMVKKSKELRKLEVHGAGPKMPGVAVSSLSSTSNLYSHDDDQNDDHHKKKKKNGLSMDEQLKVSSSKASKKTSENSVR